MNELATLINGFTTLMVTMDPPGMVPIFLARIPTAHIIVATHEQSSRQGRAYPTGGIVVPGPPTKNLQIRSIGAHQGLTIGPPTTSKWVEVG